MDPRTVPAGHGWTWIAQGYALFRRSPANWTAVVLILFGLSKLLALLPVVGVVFILLMPIFLAGLMEGCRALERGEPLQLTHLLCGFRTNAADLVTLGGISLVGNVVVMMIVIASGGEAMATLNTALAGGTPTVISPELRDAWIAVMRVLLFGTLTSLPLLLALWYAPMLVYFDDVRPLAAMKSSLFACARNAPALLVYGLVVFAGIFLAMPFAKALRQYDLALWLLAPVLVPSLYASYKDIYPAASAPAAGAEPSA